MKFESPCQRARKAVLADFHSQHTLGDAGALLAAPQGPPGGLGGRPSQPRHGRRAGWCLERRAGPLGLVSLACAASRSGRPAAGACEPRAALKVHASPIPGSARLVFALGGRRGGGRTDVVLMAASSSALCFFRAVRLRACATAARGNAAASALGTRPAMGSRAHINEFTPMGRQRL